MGAADQASDCRPELSVRRIGERRGLEKIEFGKGTVVG
jgi:hypothetical protein